MNHPYGFMAVIVLAVSICGCTEPEEQADEYGDMDFSGMRVGEDLVISNNNSWDWKYIEMELNGEYTYTFFRIRAGSVVKIPLCYFTDGDGHPFDYLTQPCRNFKIWCETPSGTTKHWPTNDDT
jgi:hypothetical protein